jgi:hypothetical protein
MYLMAIIFPQVKKVLGLGTFAEKSRRMNIYPSGKSATI